MIRQDFILDLIERLSKLLAAVLGLVEQTSVDPPPVSALNAAAERWCGLSLDLASLLSEGALVATLSPDSDPVAAGRAAALGMLLAGRGEALLRENASDTQAQKELQIGFSIMRAAARALPVTSPGLLTTMRRVEQHLQSLDAATEDRTR